MKIGYARVSTQDQNLHLQLDELAIQKCDLIYMEKVSGKDTARPEREKLMNSLRRGDIVVVWKLDRLGRSIKDLISLITRMRQLGVSFVSLHDGINTSTSTGKFIFNVFASLAEFEREIIRERTMSGLAAARIRGRKGGRPPGLSKTQLEKARSIVMMYERGKSISDIAKEFKIGRSTCYRYIEIVRNDGKL